MGQGGRRCVPWLAAACLLAGCGRSPEVQQGLAAMQRADALYAARQYGQAMRGYDEAMRWLDHRDERAFIEAGLRAEKAFCMQAFTEARERLAQGDRPLASVALATALATPGCAQFPDEWAWAKAQRP